jgi:hypothetical protein
MPRRRSMWHIAQLEYALSPRTRAGVVRGRPVTARGMRMLLRTWAKAVASLTLPGVTDGQREAPAVDGKVNLGDQPAPGPAEGLTRLRAARIFQLSPSAAPSCGRRPRAGGPG